MERSVSQEIRNCHPVLLKLYEMTAAKLHVHFWVWGVGGNEHFHCFLCVPERGASKNSEFLSVKGY